MPEKKGEAGRDDAADEALKDELGPGDADEVASQASQGTAEEKDGGDGQDQDDDSHGQDLLSGFFLDIGWAKSRPPCMDLSNCGTMPLFLESQRLCLLKRGLRESSPLFYAVVVDCAPVAKLF